MADEAEDTMTFDPTKKKKKKVKKDVVTAVDKAEEVRVETAPGKDGALDMSSMRAALGDEDKADGSEGLDFSKLKKKKKDSKKPLEDRPVAQSANAQTEPDYTYTELLKRVYEIMRETNPSGPSRLAMKPPDVQRAGTKKTSFTNFFEICKALRRKPDHFQAFLLAELGTSGSIDGNQTLIIRGRYQPKQIESVVRSYIKEYVLCHTCKSPQTKLVKDTRLFFLQCDACSSRCSVVSVKSGYQAVTGKRAAMRAKTAT